MRTITKTATMPDNAGQYLKNDEALFNFWSKVDTQGSEDCWCWTGSRNSLGYGQFIVNYMKVLVHRISLMDTGGVIEPGKVVRHSCHNPACVNPAHLSTGTQKENIQDSVLAGRMKPLNSSAGGIASAAARAARRRV